MPAGRLPARRWRFKLEPGTSVCGRRPEFLYGCYFAMTDLNVSEAGARGTGEPVNVEWLDDETLPAGTGQSGSKGSTPDKTQKG